MTRQGSSLSAGFRSVRDLYRVDEKGANRYWWCKLCPYGYFEEAIQPGWPISLQGLLLLVKHLRGHQQG